MKGKAKPEKIQTFKNFVNLFGIDVPKVIQGSPSYFGHKLQELIALCKSLGIPNLLITLTMNDGWEETKIIKGKATIDDPVMMMIIFFKKYLDIIEAIEGKNNNGIGIFGKVRACFKRIEFQNRGAPHFHILL